MHQPSSLQLDEKESSITVGKTIALLAEEGDDISNLSVPESSSSSSSSPPKSKDEPSSSSSSSSSSPSTPAAAEEKTSSPSSSPVKASDSATTSSSSSHGHAHSQYTHPRGLLASVLRLLTEGNVPASDVEKIPATGRRGQLTKSDVLLYLGKAKEEGLTKYLEWSHKKMEIFQTPAQGQRSTAGGKSAPGPEKILTGDEFRRFILKGLSRPKSVRQAEAGQTQAAGASLTFEDILEGYLPKKGLEAKVDPKLVQAGRAAQAPKDAFSEILGL